MSINKKNLYKNVFPTCLSSVIQPNTTTHLKETQYIDFQPFCHKQNFISIAAQKIEKVKNCSNISAQKEEKEFKAATSFENLFWIPFYVIVFLMFIDMAHDGYLIPVLVMSYMATCIAILIFG